MTRIIKKGCPRFQEDQEKLSKLIERELRRSNTEATVGIVSIDLLLGYENFPTWGESLSLSSPGNPKYSRALTWPWAASKLEN